MEFYDLHIYVSGAPKLIQAFRLDDPIDDASYPVEEVSGPQQAVVFRRLEPHRL